jgi:hypothetical protein
MKFRKMAWVRQATNVGEGRVANKILVESEEISRLT